MQHDRFLIVFFFKKSDYPNSPMIRFWYHWYAFLCYLLFHLKICIYKHDIHESKKVNLVYLDWVYLIVFSSSSLYKFSAKTTKAQFSRYVPEEALCNVCTPGLCTIYNSKKLGGKWQYKPKRESKIVNMVEVVYQTGWIYWTLQMETKVDMCPIMIINNISFIFFRQKTMKFSPWAGWRK